MTTNNEINWEINEPIISRYGIQTWKNGKRSPENLINAIHSGVSLNNMLNEARFESYEKGQKDTAKLMIKFFDSISKYVVTKEDWDLFIKKFNIKENDD